jgi:cytochrome c oxidase subunit II
MFTQDGEFLIQCREYCGFSHYNMKAKLFVEPAVTPVAAETPPTTATTNAAAPNAAVAPKQQQQQQQPSTNATSAASGNATSSTAAAGGGVTLTILEGASIQGSPDYDPDELKVKKGDKITVNNADTMPHTVTNGESGSDPNSGKLFDTSIMNGGDSAEIDTSTVDAGAHPYYCMVHPYMTGTLTVE